MATPLKSLYSPRFFETLCPVLHDHVPGFDCREFVFRVFNNAWPDLELKARVRHIARVLHTYLSPDFTVAADQLIHLSRVLLARDDSQNFLYLFIPDYIEVYGQEHPHESLRALENITKLVSAEFAVRPFLLHHPELAMRYFSDWSINKDASVRRLSTEGCRPYLPWAIGVPYLKKDPLKILPILERLKADTSDYVRRSVANNLNDIARDHPDLILSLAKRWHGQNSLTDQIVRHGCRTLLKKGNEHALILHGFAPTSKAIVRKLTLPSKVKIGEHLNFEFAFVNREADPTPFRLDYAIDYRTSTGKTSRKVFKISEKIFPPKKAVTIQRKQSFKNFTTRIHYKGKHCFCILANGKKMVETEFLVC